MVGRRLLLDEFRQERIGKLAFDAGKPLDHTVPAKGNIGFRIAALMDRDHAAVAQPVGSLHDHRRHLGIGRGQAGHARQRVGMGCIKPVGDDDHIRPEILDQRQRHTAHGVDIGLVPASRRQRQVGVGACAGTGAAILQPGIACREHVGLVDRQGVDVRILIENSLRPVPVMNIPVENEEPFRQPGRARGGDGDRNIGQQAESHGAVGEAMMPRRAGQRIGGVIFAAKHGQQRLAGQPG